MNVAKTMAEEIRIHSQIGRDEKGQYCKGCQHRYGYAAERKLHWDASEHVAAALSAAGYGLVTDAKREAELRGELIAKIEHLTDSAVNMHRRLALRDEIREVLRPRKASNDDQ